MLGLVITFKHHLRYLKVCCKIFLVQKYTEFIHMEGYDVFTAYFSAPKIKFVCPNDFLWFLTAPFMVVIALYKVYC